MSIFFPWTNIDHINLDYVLLKIKELTEVWNATDHEFKNVLEELLAFKNWFHTLDVSEEISAKLDEMLASGELEIVFGGKALLWDEVAKPQKIELERLFRICGDKYASHIWQGFATDGAYGYACHYLSEGNPTYLTKFDMLNGAEIATVSSTELGHGNNITIHGSHLYICPLGSDVLRYDKDTLSYVDKLHFGGLQATCFGFDGAENSNEKPFFLYVGGGTVSIAAGIYDNNAGSGSTCNLTPVDSGNFEGIRNGFHVGSHAFLTLASEAGRDTVNVYDEAMRLTHVLYANNPDNVELEDISRVHEAHYTYISAVNGMLYRFLSDGKLGTQYTRADWFSNLHNNKTIALSPINITEKTTSNNKKIMTAFSLPVPVNFNGGSDMDMWANGYIDGSVMYAATSGEGAARTLRGESFMGADNKPAFYDVRYSTSNGRDYVLVFARLWKWNGSGFTYTYIEPNNVTSVEAVPIGIRKVIIHAGARSSWVVNRQS